MKHKYKHLKRRSSGRRKKLRMFMLKSLVSFVLLTGIFFTSDRIAEFKKYITECVNKSYSVSDLKIIKNKTLDSAEEIKEAIAVFKENRQSEADTPSDSVDRISFRPPYMGEITSVYGQREHPVEKATSFHTGVDIAGNKGDTVISAAEGTVTKVGYDDKNGNYLTIRHSDKFSTSYGHLSEVCVIEGEKVDSNTKIGEMGSSGVSTGVHLHFCIFEDGKTIDPEIYIKLDHKNGV